MYVYIELKLFKSCWQFRLREIYRYMIIALFRFYIRLLIDKHIFAGFFNVWDCQDKRLYFPTLSWSWSLWHFLFNVPSSIYHTLNVWNLINLLTIMSCGMIVNNTLTYDILSNQWHKQRLPIGVALLVITFIYVYLKKDISYFLTVVSVNKF